MNIKKLYNLTDSVSKASIEFTKLHKYYVFKKNKVIQKGKGKKDMKEMNLIQRYIKNDKTINI